MRVNDYHRIYSVKLDDDARRHRRRQASYLPGNMIFSPESMEPKIIKEEVIERDSNVLDEPTVNNNNNNKESAFRIHTRKSKVKSKDTGFSSTSTSDSSGEHLLSPTTHQLPVHIDVESESSSPLSDTFRNHSKLKRFLSTLVQFSGQISSQTSERVKGQIFTLVNNLISVEEFHHNIQEMTNFPLRPFVLPFLKSHLPSLQRDLLSMARNNKQTLSQYLKQHENAYLDRDSQPSEPSEIFHQVERVPPPPPSPMPIRDNNVAAGSNKRPYPLSAATAMSAMADGYYEAGYAADLDYQQPYVKRPNLSYTVPFMYHHPHMHPQEPPPPPPAPPSQPLPPPPPSHPFNVLPMLHIRETEDHKGHVEDEWKNIHVMLNCILSMVEKTKKALGILQERGLTETNFSDWNRKRTTEEILSLTVRQTEERIENIKKKAEDSMNEIRHHAMIELQKLVLAAENKMIELVASERTRMNGNKTSGASLQISPSLITQYNSCWNCGRKAHETCSGCNTAQYCSSFCQHKDWEAHHQTCCVHSATATAVHQQQQQAATATSPAGKKQQPPPSVGSSSSSDDPSAVGHRQPTTAAGPLSLKMSSSVSATDVSESAVDKQCNHKIGQRSSPPLANAAATTTVTTTTTTTTTTNANSGSDIGGSGSDGGRQQ